MSLGDPAEFARAFSNAFADRDPAAIAALFAEDADFLSLTGAWAEGRAAVGDVLGAEMDGMLARARLVSGRTKMRAVAPGVAQVMQRFVLSGLVHPDGSDAGRIGAVLSALLRETAAGWEVIAAQFTAEG